MQANPKYQVAYEGQILTNPLDFEVAHYIAAAENLDTFALGHVSVCEVVIAQSPSLHARTDEADQVNP